MTWTDHIHADPAVLGGKPVIKGTRLAEVLHDHTLLPIRPGAA